MRSAVSAGLVVTVAAAFGRDAVVAGQAAYERLARGAGCPGGVLVGVDRQTADVDRRCG
jgi:hypothetical protein